jgi:tetratricopeptide (TPR) repeat protein
LTVPVLLGVPSDYATTLNNLGYAYVDLGDFTQAEIAYRDALRIRQQVLGESNENAVSSQDNLLRLREKQRARLVSTQDLDSARKVSQEALALEEKLHSPNHWRAIDARWELRRVDRLAALSHAQRRRLEDGSQWLTQARQLDKQKQPQAGLELCRRALAVRKELLGEDHPDTALALYWMGEFQASLGDFVLAEEAIRNAAEIERKVLGEAHPEYATMLGRLGHVYANMNELVRAEACYRQALRIHQEAVGEKGRQYAGSMHNLGVFLSQSLKQHADAVDLLRRALDIRTRVLGAEHTDTATTTGWLGWVYYQDDKPAEAESLLVRAVELRRKLGEQASGYRESLHDLTAFYQSRQEFARAEARLLECLRLLNTSQAPHAPELADDRQRLVKLYDRWTQSLEQRHEFATAGRIQAKALGVIEELLGKEHWQTRTARLTLASLEMKSHFTQEQVRLLDEADSHLRSARALGKEGKPGDGLRLVLHSLETYQKLFGRAHLACCDCLLQLGQLFDQTGDYLTSESYFRQRLDILTATLGRDYPDTSSGLDAWSDVADKLARQQEQKQALTAVREIFLEQADRLKKHRGPNHWRTVDARWRLARIERLAALDPGGRQRLHEADELLRSAEDLLSQGNIQESLARVQQACDARRDLLNPDHPDYADGLELLGRVYFARSDFKRAGPVWRQARSIRLKALGEMHPDFASSLDWLGWLYFEMRDDDQAASLWVRAREIREATLAADHPLRARSLNNLWLLYSSQGNLKQAEPLYRELLAIHRQAWGEEHPEFASSLDTLARLHQSMGDQELTSPGAGFARAESLYLRAEALYQRAQLIRKKARGEQHADYARGLDRLGALYLTMGRLEQADKSLTQAIEIRKIALGEKHPEYAQSLHHLGLVRSAQGDFVRAAVLLRQAVEITRQNLELTFAVQSERQQLLLARALRTYLDAYLRLATQTVLPGDETYQYVLAWKGAVFARQQRLRLERKNPDLAEGLASLRRTAAQLASLAFAVPQQQERAAWQRRMAELTEIKEQLEGELAQKSTAFKEQQDLARLDALAMRAALPPDTLLIDYLVYEFLHVATQDPMRGTWERRLIAFVVRPEQPVLQVDLGPMVPIASLIDQARAHLVEGDVRPDNQLSNAAAELRGKIWEPLQPYLSGNTTVLVSPDGALARFPLTALPGTRPETYLLEERPIAILPVPQVLPQWHERRQSAAAAQTPISLFALGDVDFGAARSATRFPPLPGTVQELEAIQQLYRATYPRGTVSISRQAQATEAAFRELAPGKRYLHLATHGFFAPPALRSFLDDSPAAVTDVDSSSASGSLRHLSRGLPPGLLSGLALAGANEGSRSPATASRGITAS